MPKWQKGIIMLMRLRNVRFSVFDPKEEKWVVNDNMSVLIQDGFIYAVKTEPFEQAVNEKLEENDEYKSTEDDKKRESLWMECFNKMLDECIISDKLQAIIYSGNLSWKVEKSNNEG